jgi:DNA-directed RNA polymerase III subunit RPC4
VTAATQASFLQHIVHVDYGNSRINVLGEVNRRFIASPDISTLLSQLKANDTKSEFSLGEGLISMDAS